METVHIIERANLDSNQDHYHARSSEPLSATSHDRRFSFSIMNFLNNVTAPMRRSRTAHEVKRKESERKRGKEGQKIKKKEKSKKK